MPLPSVRLHGAKQCRARTKSSGLKKQCANPAAYGMPVCRFHGAHKKILKGKDHPNYRHGKQMQATREKNHALSLQLAELEEVGFAIGLLQGNRTRGRKAKRIKK
jgi:hypothetical protein